MPRRHEGEVADAPAMIGLAEWVADVVEQLGYVGLLLLVAAENLFPPLPSELILPLAGFLVGQDRMSFAAAVTAATAGSLLGAMILYGLGALVGEERIRAWMRRVPLLEERDADRAHAWFARHGAQAVLFGRLIPVVRSLISLPAGIERMPLARFVLYTTLGSGAWNVGLIGAGWLLGERWDVVRQLVSRFELVLLIMLAAALASFVIVRSRRRRTSDPSP